MPTPHKPRENDAFISPDEPNSASSKGWGRRGLSRRALFGAAGAAALGTASGGFLTGEAVGDRQGDRWTTWCTRSAASTKRASRPPRKTACISSRSTFAPTAAAMSWRCCNGGRLQPNVCVAGREVGTYGAVSGPYDAPPDDTGEALDLPPAGLTITFGFGRSFFADKDGTDRFGVADRMPASLVELPHFPGDTLESGRSGGDICVQACSNDPQVAVHAVRNLARLAFGVAAVRWSQLGFGRTSSTSTDANNSAQSLRLQRRHRQSQGRARRN